MAEKVVTEEEALKRAKKDGIEFTDTFHVVKLGEGLGGEVVSEGFETREEAEAELDKLSKKSDDEFSIRQTRERKQVEEK
jgi:hypothetical protein